MDKYQIRRVIVQLISVAGIVAGIAIANNALNNITTAINALGDSDYIAGSSQQFGLNLASLIGGGVVSGFSLATLLWVMVISAKDAIDNRPRQPLRK